MYEEQGSRLLPAISIVLTAISIIVGGVLSFWTYSLPGTLLLAAPYTGWTLFIVAAMVWFTSLVCAISAISRKRSGRSKLALVISLSAPVFVVGLATAYLLIGLNDHPFVF